jgi:thioredoxin reductase
MNKMSNPTSFDVIIVGGSYSGLAAAMALGRALMKVLVIDDATPCNHQTPHSHNFLTQDGQTPKQIATAARLQVQRYPTIAFHTGLAISATKTTQTVPAGPADGFQITTQTGETFQVTTDSSHTFHAGALIFATGISDLLPPIDGLADCWGISVLHCPYCHGYEVRNEPTGILANGEAAYQLVRLITNWTQHLTVYTNGASTLDTDQEHQLKANGIAVIDKPIKHLNHSAGNLQQLVFADGSTTPLKALYTKARFEQHCPIPQELGCQLTEEGYLKVDASQETTVPGVYACGDNSSGTRTVANAVASGTATGIAVSKKIILARF